MKFIDILPTTEESCEAAESLEIHTNVHHGITDDALARVLPYCHNLQAVKLTGVPDLSDRSLVSLAQATTDLRYIDLSGCKQLTDVGVLELASQANRLEVVKLNGISGLTDPSISTLVRSLSRLVELDAADLPLVTSYSVRDIWTFGKKLRKVRLCRCGHLDDKGFPVPFNFLRNSSYVNSVYAPVIPVQSTSALEFNPVWEQGGDRRSTLGLGATVDPIAGDRISSWLDAMAPLILPAFHLLEQLHTLDLTQCRKITDIAVAGIVIHAPRLQHIHLAGCSLLTNAALERLCSLTTHLESLTIAHAEKITDPAIVDLVRSCPRLEVVDVSYCPLLSDLSILELAILPHLRRLSLASLPRVTDISLLFLAEHGVCLTHLQIAHCEQIALSTVHVLLRRLQRLVYLSTSGIPSTSRVGIRRFSEPPPPNYTSRKAGPYCVFRGEAVAQLRRFLDKEEIRQREAERRNIPFIPRGDDSMDLY
ncbi:RNI-like protein [Irpex rosettiformis]|uniref:RNI-like protein n=1 Tax=Irpex rosettiformis TaxID=378272 RepID=A0ACB8U4T2_9APHY|nr:RNI-like protein [Irpex rosettiformis]